MTRELKLSLILGFSLVLIVTVLISDYLSKARTTRLDGTNPGAPVALAVPGPGDLLSKSQQQEEEEARQVALAKEKAASEPIRTNFGSNPGPAQPALAGKTPDVKGADPKNAPTSGGPVLIGQGGKKPVVPGATPNSTPSSAPGLSGAEQLAAGNSSDKTHTIASGESWYAITKRYYKDARLVKQLAMYNNLKPDAPLKVGSTLKIPTADALTGKVTRQANSEPLMGKRPAVEGDDEVKLAANTREAEPIDPLMALDRGTKPAGKAPGKDPAPEAAPAKPAKAGTYVVKKGDTLGHIAAAELGSSRRASEIQELNNGVDEYSLRVGMVIKLPSK